MKIIPVGWRGTFPSQNTKVLQQGIYIHLYFDSANTAADITKKKKRHRSYMKILPSKKITKLWRRWIHYVLLQK